MTNERLTKLMEEAVAFSTQHVIAGGIPFTAFVVDSRGHIVGRGVNRVREHSDCTAHAEIEAIRDAGLTLNSHALQGMTLLASGEPCAMCYLSARYAGISQIYFAVGRNDAAKYGFDYRSSYKILAEDPLTWTIPTSKKFSVQDELKPFLYFIGESR